MDLDDDKKEKKTIKISFKGIKILKVIYDLA